MNSQDHFKGRDPYRMQSILEFSHNPWVIHRDPKTSWLMPISKLFALRCARLRMLMQLPFSIASTTIKMQRALDEAHIAVIGALDKSDISEEELQAIATLTNDSLIAQSNTNFQRRTSKDPDWDRDVLEDLKSGLAPLDVIQAGPVRLSLDALLMAYITGSWTTIETLFGDLWEICLNERPEPLARLQGAPNRIKSNEPTPKRAKDKKESKAVDLDILVEHGFDIRRKMGSVLKSRFAFNRLSGIREAYSCAFENDCSLIDKALRDRALDALNTVRNLLIHRDGIADADYVKRLVQLPTIPKAKRDEQIVIDGDTVVALLKPAITAANALLLEIDAWMVKHPMKN